MQSVAKHLYRATNSFERITYPVEMLHLCLMRRMFSMTPYWDRL